MSELGGIHSTTFDAELRNVSFALISFMGFPAILSTLQPFQIYIYHRKYSKLTFSNDSQLMGKRFMAYWHASLESTCKSRISKISTRCQNWGDPFHNFWCWIQKCKFCIDIFYGVSCNIKHIKYSKLTFSNDSQLMGKRFMANMHASLESTCKSRISKISTRCQNWGGSIPQLLMLNSEM